MQSTQVAEALQHLHPGLTVELVVISTTGDQITDKPLHEFGGKGLFTKELELALLSGQVDFAVHSFKDVPVTMPLVDQEELVIAAVPQRADVRDVLVSRKAHRIADLPAGARVGTGSLRRQCQLLAIRPDVQVMMIRGNVDTRVRKLNDGAFDAIILAAAGLHRIGYFDPSFMFPIEQSEMLPAAGQGALALQCRRDNGAVRELLAKLDHPPTAQAVALERQVVQGLDGDCQSPIGAYAMFSWGGAELWAVVGKRGGGLPMLKARATGSAAVREVLAHLAAQGVHRHLHG
jgi:hydroxymethylbilane synthase